MRNRRRQLTEGARRQLAEELARNTRKHPLLLNSRHIGAFLAADGEIDPWPLMADLWALGKRIYLPVLVPHVDGRLWFARFEPGDELAYNRYGIAEPVRRSLHKCSALDLVLTPLVAFDGQGHRIGMGGGYYDRTFGFLRSRKFWNKPLLLGLAYAFQEQRAIRARPWDVPLHAVATEQGCRVFGT